MRTPLPALLLALAAGALRAELPPAVLEACLRPTLTEHASGQTWAAMTRAKWEAAPLRVHERGGLQVAEADGLAPTNGWAAVTLTLSQRQQTAANPRPMQTFAVSARPVHPLREATFDVALIRDAPLPPCSVRQWGGRVALVAEAGDWYVVAGDPKATLTRTEGAEPRWTLALKGLRATPDAPATASLLVGEGALPPEPRTVPPPVRRAPPKPPKAAR